MLKDLTCNRTLQKSSSNFASGWLWLYNIWTFIFWRTAPDFYMCVWAFRSTLQCWWRCKCLASERAGRNLPRRKLWCSCKWRTLGRSCLSPSSHSGCSPHWRAHIHKMRATVMTQQSTIGCRIGMRLWEVEENKNTQCAGQSTDLFFCSSSKLAAFHSEPWNDKRGWVKATEIKKRKAPQSRLPYRCQHRSPSKRKLGSHDDILVKANFWQFTDQDPRRFYHQGGKTSMSQFLKPSNHPPGRGSQKFWMVCPSEPKWPGFHCQYTSYRVSSRSLTCWSDCRAPGEATTTTKKKLYIKTEILIVLNIVLSLTPFKSASSWEMAFGLTILDVRLSRSAWFMMSLRCFLISISLESLSAELHKEM